MWHKKVAMLHRFSLEKVLEKLHCFANTRAVVTLLKNAVKLVASLLLVTVNPVHDKSVCSVMIKTFVWHLTTAVKWQTTVFYLAQGGTHRHGRSAKTNCATMTGDWVCVCVCAEHYMQRDTHTHLDTTVWLPLAHREMSRGNALTSAQ